MEEKKLTMRVFLGTPDGCECDPSLYRNAYVWALYENETFVAASPPFASYDTAYDAGVKFCQTLPGQASQENTEN